jgi:hypothetical protein
VRLKMRMDRFRSSNYDTYLIVEDAPVVLKTHDAGSAQKSQLRA